MVWRDLSGRTIFLHRAIADYLGLNLTDHKSLDILQQTGPMIAGKLAEALGLAAGAIIGRNAKATWRAGQTTKIAAKL